MEMKPIEEVSPSKSVMAIYMKYMDKCINLNDEERKVYIEFLKLLMSPRVLVDPSKIHMGDLINSNKPGAIIRRSP